MKLTEEQFWKRYFQSKLFNAHRASIRSSATQHVVKDDPIFDKYLEKDDDGEFYLFPFHSSLTNAYKELEPRRQRSEVVGVFVDLAATMEDHENVCTPTICLCKEFISFASDWQ
jgi:transcription initiation factor TFIIH subunit 1